MTPEALDRMVLAAAEAFNNVILHAAGDWFSVTVSRDDGACVVEISDSGAGFYVPDTFEMPPSNDVAHRGLALMQALVDRVDVASSSTGTEVELVQRLSPNGVTALAAGA
jgi:anti-sigma regulatory factor (Ser/Thr protein kinase)